MSSHCRDELWVFEYNYHKTHQILKDMILLAMKGM